MPRIWDDKENEGKRATEESGSRPSGHAVKERQRDSDAHLSSPAPRADAWMRRPILRADHLFWAVLILALLLTSGDLYRRLRVEWSHRVAAIVVDYRDLSALSRQSGVNISDLYTQLAASGACGVTVGELTGKDLTAGFLPLTYGPLASFMPVVTTLPNLPMDRAALLVARANPDLPRMLEYLKLRMPDTAAFDAGVQTLIVLPGTVDELSDAGLLPDFGALAFVRAVSTAALYRPYPASGVDGEKAAASLAWLKKNYPEVACIIPAGQIVAGYPQLQPIAATLKELDIPVAQAEFVRQIGAAQLYGAVKPDILPLHSLVREELISRRMSRGQVIERMVRAVHERSIRLLLLRPYDLYSVGKLPAFVEDMQKISDSLRSRGYAIGWPDTLPLFRASPGAALGLAAVFLACLWAYIRRYVGVRRESALGLEVAAVTLGTIVLGMLVWRVGLVSRLLGGFTAALVATEATLWALDRYERLFAGLVAGLAIVLAGGLCIASFYGTTLAMLRLTPFSGVKLTLLLPPLLILANDLKRRIHPESFVDIMRRPPLWGELVLVGVLLVGALVLTVRSDNVAFVPGWEVRFRDMLERLLWVRPRTKEFLVGYPCLILYYAIVKRGWAEHYREVFRIGASLAFASAVNTFCHFHTLLPLTVVRVVNGWWLGILVGFVVLVIVQYIGGPIWRRGGRELFE